MVNDLKNIVPAMFALLLQGALGEPAACGRQPVGAAPPQPRHRDRHTHHRRRRGGEQGLDGRELLVFPCYTTIPQCPMFIAEGFICSFEFYFLVLRYSKNMEVEV